MSRNDFTSPFWNLEGNLCEICEGNLDRNISTVSRHICFLESIITVKDSVVSLPVLSLKVIMSFCLDCFQISFLSLVFRNMTDKFLFSLHSLAWGLQCHFSLWLGIFHCFQKILLYLLEFRFLHYFSGVSVTCVFGLCITYHLALVDISFIFHLFFSPCFRQDISIHLSAPVDH